jgi:two-component system LytT family response regulator
VLQQLNRIQIRTLKCIYIVNIKDIIRCEANNNYTTIYLQNEKSILASRTLKEFEKLLPYPVFLRIHQSHLVNSNFIKRIEKMESRIYLNDDTILPIAFRKHHLIIQYLETLPAI